MSSARSKIFIGCLVYGQESAKYLPYFLPSLRAQLGDSAQVLILDNGPADFQGSGEYIKKNFPEIAYERAESNLGFARGHNYLLGRARAAAAQYYLALNPDLILGADAVKILSARLGRESTLGAVSPKILRWDFIRQQKTNIIDSGGIVMKAGLRFFDLAQGEPDRGQVDNAQILGPSGAAGFYRLSALEQIKDREAYFDEDMFMYKEDCDLAYRLRRAGWQSVCESKALVWHDRSIGGAGQSVWSIVRNRAAKDRTAKIWSFYHQHIIFGKYWSEQAWLGKIAILAYAGQMFFFTLLFEPYLLRQYLCWWSWRRARAR